MCARRALKAGPGGDVAQGPLSRQRKPEPDLFCDPMPMRVEPCLALLSSKAPAGPDWAYEVKWDGYRLAVHIDRGKVRIITRGGHDWTHRFPAIAFEAAGLPVETAILDGEAVVLGQNGASDFGALQRSLGGRGGKAPSKDAILYAFDLLYLDGHDLRSMSLTERRLLLLDIVDGEGAIRMSEEVVAGGSPFLRQACAMGLEGIIAKRRSAPYRSGRGGEWLKIKCVQSEGFAIIGYEPSAAALSGIGKLLVAARKGAALVHVGGVGTGFSAATGSALKRQLDQILIPKPALRTAGRRRSTRWVEPVLVAEIEFRAWTDDGNLRHASYKGLREAADADEVYEISR